MANIIINKAEAEEIAKIIRTLEELPTSDYINKTSMVDIEEPLKFLGKVVVEPVYNRNGFAPCWLIANEYRRVLRMNGFTEPKKPVFDGWDCGKYVTKASIWADMIFA